MAGWVGEHGEGRVGDVGTVVQEACAQSFGARSVPLELVQALDCEVHVHLHRHRFGRPGGGSGVDLLLDRDDAVARAIEKDDPGGVVGTSIGGRQVALPVVESEELAVELTNARQSRASSAVWMRTGYVDNLCLLKLLSDSSRPCLT
jgi:hypothetical protein